MYVHKPYCIFIIALYLHLCLSLSMQCLYIESCFEGVIYIFVIVIVMLLSFVLISIFLLVRSSLWLMPQRAQVWCYVVVFSKGVSVGLTEWVSEIVTYWAVLKGFKWIKIHLFTSKLPCADIQNTISWVTCRRDRTPFTCCWCWPTRVASAPKKCEAGLNETA